MLGLGERAVKYYTEGYNCSRCIIKAAEDTYGIMADEVVKALGGISSGLGVGAVCSVPLACILTLGLLYDEENVIKGKRLEFLMEFKRAFGTINCGQIQGCVSLCTEVIKIGCDILEKIIGEEKKIKALCSP